MSKKYSFEEIENYIVDRELDFVEENPEIERLIAENEDYKNIKNVQNMISEALREKEFIFKNTDKLEKMNLASEEKNNILSTLKKIFFFEESTIPVGVFGKFALAMVIILVFMIPVRMHMKRQIDFMEKQAKLEASNRKVAIKPNQYFEAEKQVIDWETTNRAFAKVEIDQNKKADKERRESITEKETKVSDLGFANLDDEMSKNNTDEEKLSKIERKKSDIDSSKLGLASLSETELSKEEKNKSISSEELVTEKEIKDSNLGFAKANNEENKNRNYINQSEIKDNNRVAIRAKKGLRTTKKPKNDIRQGLLDGNNIQAIKPKDIQMDRSEYIKVVGVKQNKIYTKIQPKFEKEKGYKYKFYINEKIYKEGEEFNIDGRHKLKIEIFNEKKLIDTVEIDFEIRN